ncbi:carboxyl transferase domain-containing protein, partial [Micrococcus sp. F3Y]|uniref:carboxyl transferase domain-containing protein n=1 Tax=Micrococcus sp. F3Y TaxID=3402627 RepID=UPI003AF632FF
TWSDRSRRPCGSSTGANQPYDMLEVIASIVDEGHLLQLQELYAPNVITGLARLDGMSVGVVANQPMQFAGTLDIAASQKRTNRAAFSEAAMSRV